MTTFAIAVTAQPTNSPPRVKVDVTTSGTPVVTSVTVVRTDSSGRTSTVRTSNGGPLQLTVSGSTYVGTVYDVELSYGMAATYSLVESPTTVSAPVTVSPTSVWLVHPGVPDRSIPIDLRAGSFGKETRSVNAGVFYPMLRTNAVVISDGRRKGRQSSFTVATTTLAALNQLDSLLDDASVLLLNVPPSLGLGIDSSYVFIQDVDFDRPSGIGSEQYRETVLPYVVVDQPAGGTQAQYSWADVIAKYSTWQALKAANATWAAAQAPTN